MKPSAEEYLKKPMSEWTVAEIKAFHAQVRKEQHDELAAQYPESYK